MEILQKTLDQMDFSFSSNQFAKKAKRNGLSKREIANGVIAIYLHRHAKQGQTRRTWTKKGNGFTEKDRSDEIMKAIDLLKDNGYKILRPVSEWTEI